MDLLTPDFLENFEYYISLSSGIFLLFLAVSGNYVAQTLGCKTRYALQNNMYLKHMVVFFMTYFTINFSSSKKEHPIDTLKGAFLVYLFYVFFGRMHNTFIVIVIGLLLITYILNNYRNYYKVEGEKQSKFDKQLQKAQTIVLGLSAIFVLIGSLLYLNEKRAEYGKKFNVVKFIFGVKNCKSMKTHHYK